MIAPSPLMEAKKSPLATVLDCVFLLRIALLAPVWTILLVGWIASRASAKVSWVRSPFFCPDMSSLYLWLALAGFSLVVASIYVVNQIADIESDRINHKLFLLPHGYLSPRTAWVLAGACGAAGIASAFYFDATMAALYGASLLLGFCYNLPPLRLKNRAWGGVIANIAGHGVLTFLVGWHAGHFPGGEGGPALMRGLLSSLSPGAAIAAVFLATTIPDAEGDRLTKKKTFCIRYGEKKTAVASALFCAAALLLSLFMENHFWVMAVPSALSLALFIALAVRANKQAAFHAFKWPVFLLTAFVVAFVPIYGILILLTFFGSRAYYRWRFGIEYPTFKTK
jgi:4-hydroxybenzoate polyprenyltransferase